MLDPTFMVNASTKYHTDAQVASREIIYKLRVISVKLPPQPDTNTNIVYM